MTVATYAISMPSFAYAIPYNYMFISLSTFIKSEMAANKPCTQSFNLPENQAHNSQKEASLKMATGLFKGQKDVRTDGHSEQTRDRIYDFTSE